MIILLNTLQLHTLKSPSDHIKHLKKLEEFNVGFNYIGDKGLSVLSLNFTNNLNLTRLNFRAANIGDDGMIDLAKQFQFMTGLRYLNLSSNYITNISSEVIGPGLQQLINLTAFNISDNKIEDKGSVAIGIGLSSLTKLVKFNTYLIIYFLYLAMEQNRHDLATALYVALKHLLNKLKY